ncbi:MAG: VOC family protein [Parvularcula sp.]|jgi:catechol 2,3-dioxygenase-like lactoylglutathione lyase family enzyme|nr:VOC family protein [Parvularcula sp.]
MQDIFVPESAPGDALVSPLHTVTYVTASPGLLERALIGGYDLTAGGWNSPGREIKEYLGFRADHDLKINIFAKEGEGANIKVRVIHIADKVPEVRPEYLGLYTGGTTLSFPMEDLRAHEKRMNAIGVESTIGVKEMDFTSPKGEVYTSAEIVYKAPDHAFLMGVTRPDIFVPTGPIDPSTGIGGPSYSARCLGNAQETLEFFRDVLGFEVRRDVVFEVGERSALLMPEGTRERFIQCFAPGSQTGYCVLMDHHEATIPSPAPGFGPPNRGIVMWSFLARDFDEVKRRIADARIVILQREAGRSSPGLPSGRTMVIEDPDGFPIEICEA